jgi:hypothetical protein
MAYILPGPPFLPRGGFSESGDGGTDPNGVPWCPVDVPCGWECPRCRRVWSPAVPVCRNCPEPPAFIAKDAPAGSLAVPPEMMTPGHQRYVRITGEWAEIIPGLQCRYGGTGDCAVVGRAAPDVSALFNLRVTPAGNDPGLIETGR